jgi:type IV pilus assembly protein PilB
MGVEPYMLASSLVGIVAQRLVRKVCPFCSEWGEMTPEEEAIAGVHFDRIKHPKGCRQCNNTGYKGRISIHEILSIDKPVRAMITNGAAVEDIKEYAIREQGMSTLKQSALNLVQEGTTTIEELLRVSYYE